MATQTGSASQQFCVRWNSHLGSLGAAFPQLLSSQRFVDVTLACEGHQIHCHRLLLAACSTFFETLLSDNPCDHPIIILPHDIKLWMIQALIDFMYKGEVNVSQDGLPELLTCAETLQIRGLHGSDTALNLDQIANLSTAAGKPEPVPTNAQNIPKRSDQIPSPLPLRLPPSALSQNSDRALIEQSLKIENTQNQHNGNFTKRMSIDEFQEKLSGALAKSQKANVLAIPKPEPEDISIEELEEIESIGHDPKDGTPDITDFMEDLGKSQTPPLANVVCEYENNLRISDSTSNASRIRRSEALLQQAAECVSRGQTFKTVSDLFSIPISTIRFYMARKGILPRRKRGRSVGISFSGSCSKSQQNSSGLQ